VKDQSHTCKTRTSHGTVIKKAPSAKGAVYS
jgi:hypothetical protein